MVPGARLGRAVVHRWNGVGGLATIEPIGLKNYSDIFSIYPPFWPALLHNVIWLGVLMFIATPFGMFLAVLLDREIRGLSFYQSVFFLPVVLSLAIIGFIVDLFFAPEQGLVNNLLGTRSRSLIDWLGTRTLNLFAVMLFASWRHAGYIMVLYLAGLKSVDPSLREAAAIDGANQRQTSSAWSSRPCSRSTSSCWSSRSSRRCARSTWSTWSTRAATASN